MPVPLIRQGYYPNDDDYYIILDVDFNASQENIAAAYRNLARQYHPDKNNQDERSRREAEIIFHKIKTAYDVLSDPHKRKIYDTLGPEGLKLDGWKLVRKQMTAQEIRDEFQRLQKQQLEDQQASIAKPRASFEMAVDASEVFKSTEPLGDDDDDDVDDDPLVMSLVNRLMSVEVRSLSTSMAVDNNITTNHSLTLSGTLSARNGIGDGYLNTIYQYKYSPDTKLNFLVQFGRGPIFSIGAYHKLNNKTSLSCRSMLISDAYSLGHATKFTLTHRIRDYLIGKVTYKEGINSSVTTTLIYLNEKLMFEVTTSYKLSQLNQGVSVDFGYTFNNNESKLTVSLAGTTNEGLSVEYGCETRVFKINVIGASLSVGLQAGITLKLRYNRANQEISIPIYLSDEVHSAPVFYGTMVPLLAYYIVERCYLRQYKKVSA